MRNTFVYIHIVIVLIIVWCSLSIIVPRSQPQLKGWDQNRWSHSCHSSHYLPAPHCRHHTTVVSLAQWQWPCGATWYIIQHIIQYIIHFKVHFNLHSHLRSHLQSHHSVCSITMHNMTQYENMIHHSAIVVFARLSSLLLNQCNAV